MRMAMRAAESATHGSVYPPAPRMLVSTVLRCGVYPREFPVTSDQPRAKPYCDCRFV
jgi:hypothetical protein